MIQIKHPFIIKHFLALVIVVAALVTFSISIFIITSSHAATQSATGTITGITGKCLDNKARQEKSGNTIWLYHCNSTVAQQWTLIGSDADIEIRYANSNYCLDVRGGSKQSETPIQLYSCNNTGAQRWHIMSNGNIVNSQSGLCLDDKYSGTDDKNPIWAYTCFGADNLAQKWLTPQSSPINPQPVPNPNPQPSGGGNGGNTSNPSGKAAPVGNIPGWRQVFVDDFTRDVPQGAFSDCDHNTNSTHPYCNGLKRYGNYFNSWWAYPNNWPDTAKSGADGNGGAPFGGMYHPEDTVFVDNSAMHIHMYRPSRGGDNHVAAVVPVKCMGQKYGRYTERFKVVHADAGFKSAHLFYDGGFEIDYPENDYGTRISAYTHPGEANFSTNAKWTDWHTTTIEWTPGKIRFYIDDKLTGTTTSKVPGIPMSWILQNESSIMGPYAKPGASAQLDIDWVACYAQS